MRLSCYHITTSEKKDITSIKTGSTCCGGQLAHSPEIRKNIGDNRQERESCLNNINLSKEKSRRLLDQTYSKKSYNKFLKRSLENVSTNPYGEFETDESTLQRSRSLAISRETIFNEISIPSSNRQRRQQLIPRAKLIDKIGVKERCGSKDRIHEIYQSKDKLRKCSSISSDYILPHSRALDSDFGLSLPNYYPDSDISLTDLSSDKFSFKDEKKSQSTNNLYRQDSAEVIYHDNISFGKSFDDKYLKPRTIRHYTPFDHDLNHFYEGKPRSLPNCSIKFEEESNLYDSADLKIYEELDEVFKEETSDFSQSDLNFDEINLNNDNITKASSVDSCFENNPIYDEIPPQELPKESGILKTCVQVRGEDKEEEYKTIIKVDEEVKEPPRHSHNYLKDFIESQKGSKKPLQNFLSRKISRALEGTKKEEANQYYSLPDLSIGKNLRHCEKIDKKLRKCDSSNRFIVNIGRHFDVTAESNIPVDFEVKISKIPKLKRSKSSKSEGKDEEFIDAVKNLNTTLNGIQHSKQETAEVNKQQPVKRLGRPKYKKHKESIGDTKSEKTKLPRITEVVEMDVECNKEYQKKLGTMRNYWGKIGETEKPRDELTKCKIVDVQTKVEDVIKKFENKEEKDVEKQESIVKVTKQVFEKSGKGSPIKEKVDIFENRGPYESLNPNIVEIIEKDPEKQQTVKSLSDAFETEFDHVRYRVMKSDLFQKNIFANCQKESQFDGLMQYLQHYSFQELLIDNNIVIIEPIRTKVEHEVTPSTKSPKNITKMLHKSQNVESKDASLRRRFFYHPIRVNKEMNEDELPNPDTVKLVRQLFEHGLKKSQSSQGLDNIKPTKKTVQYQTIDPDKDNCSITDSSNTTNPSSETGSNDNEELCCELQYVSEDVLQKIRECGTSVTYYGGRVMEKNCDSNPMTETIMEEIKKECKCTHVENKDTYNGVKFKLLKSNSCSSRIELVGTENLEKYKQKYFDKQKDLIDQKNRENQRKNSCISEQDENETKKVNETKDEKQLTQWRNLSEQKTYNNIMFSKTNKKSNYDYHNYEQIRRNSKKMDEIEFENYEIAGT